MRFVICSRCEKVIKKGERCIPVSVKYPKGTRFQIYTLTFLNFCEKCAKKLKIVYKVE